MRAIATLPCSSSNSRSPVLAARLAFASKAHFNQHNQSLRSHQTCVVTAPDAAEVSGRVKIKAKASAVQQELPQIRRGDTIIGTVIFSNPRGARVAIAGHEGLVGYVPDDHNPVATLGAAPSVDKTAVRPRDRIVLPVGHTRPFKVLSTPTDMGPTGTGPLLSAWHHDFDLAWKRMSQVYEATQTYKDLYRVCATGYNAGGLLTQLCGVLGFIPWSQLARRPGVPFWSEENVHKLLGTKLVVAVNECVPGRQRLVMSEKVAYRYLAQRKLAVGQLVQGQVTAVTDFGVFVALDSVEAVQVLLPLYAMSNDRVPHASDLFTVGEHIVALVAHVDHHTGHVTISTRCLEQAAGDMWSKRQQLYEAAIADDGEAAFARWQRSNKTRPREGYAR